MPRLLRWQRRLYIGESIFFEACTPAQEEWRKNQIHCASISATPRGRSHVKSQLVRTLPRFLEEQRNDCGSCPDSNTTNDKPPPGRARRIACGLHRACASARACARARAHADHLCGGTHGSACGGARGGARGCWWHELRCGGGNRRHEHFWLEGHGTYADLPRARTHGLSSHSNRGTLQQAP